MLGLLGNEDAFKHAQPINTNPLLPAGTLAYARTHTPAPWGWKARPDLTLVVYEWEGHAGSVPAPVAPPAAAASRPGLAPPPAVLKPRATGPGLPKRAFGAPPV